MAMTKTWNNHINAAGTSNSEKKFARTPRATAIAEPTAMSGGTTATPYIETTQNSANGSEKLTPENQFLVLHSHISANVLYMRVLISAGACSIDKRPPECLIRSASRASSITSSFNAS